MSKSFWDKPPIAIAHRGGDAAGDDQENTLAAFKAAAKLGYDYGETDVILAASGEVVVIHGSRNIFQAGLKGDFSRSRLQKMSLSQIRKTLKAFGIQVPTLNELISELPKMRFLIDPKTDEVVLPLANLLKKQASLNRFCVGSFSYDRVKQLIKLVGPSVSSSFIIGRSLQLVNKSSLMLKKGRLSDIEAVQLHHSLVSRQMVDLVHQQGFKALIWTCNSRLSINNAVDCGADGIISDRVRLLKEVLAG